MSFDYKQYVDVDAEPESFKREIEAVIKHMASTPEGLHLIKKAFHMNGDEPIRVNGDVGASTSAFPGEGLISVGRDKLKDIFMRSSEGGVIQMSLNRAIFHEFYHMADEKILEFRNSSPAEQQGVIEGLTEIAITEFIRDKVEELGIDMRRPDGSKIEVEDLSVSMQNQVLDAIEKQQPGSIDYLVNSYIKNFLPHEVDAVNATNEFMSKYFDEAPRGRYQDVSKGGTPELEIYTKPNEPSSAPQTIPPTAPPVP